MKMFFLFSHIFLLYLLLNLIYILSSSASTLALILSSTPISSSVVIPNITHSLFVSPSPTSYADSPSSPHIENNHPVITCGKSGVFKSRTYNTSISSFSIPTTVNDVLHQPHWYVAMHEEYKDLCTNQTWTLTTLPPGIQPVGCKWIFKNN